MSKISVIVPVYKVEKYLNRCVDSILSQTFTDFELILVDDGSPDNCPAMCDGYAKQDSRVYVIHQENGGLSAARNAGIDWAFVNSDSEWLTFIDSDDWVHKKYLELLYNAVIETGARIGICDYQKTYGEDILVDLDKFNFRLENSETVFCERFIVNIIACGKLYKKEDFFSIRYPIGRLHEDGFTTYKLLFRYPVVAFVPLPLYAYYHNEQGIMNSKWTASRYRDIFDAKEEQIEFFQQNNHIKALKHSIGVYVGFFKEIERLQLENPVDQSMSDIYEEKRKKVKQYIKILNPNNPKDEYILFQIYPRRMQLYIRWRALKNKIKKIFKKKEH